MKFDCKHKTGFLQLNLDWFIDGDWNADKERRAKGLANQFHRLNEKAWTDVCIELNRIIIKSMDELNKKVRFKHLENNKPSKGELFKHYGFMFPLSDEQEAFLQRQLKQELKLWKLRHYEFPQYQRKESAQKMLEIWLDDKTLNRKAINVPKNIMENDCKRKGKKVDWETTKLTYNLF